MESKLIENIVIGSIVVIVALGGVTFFSWEKVNWGKIELKPTETIAVLGQAQGQQLSQVAELSATVQKVNDDKQRAVNEVNDSTSQIISQLKDFGIEDKDIKTQTISINQEEDFYQEEGRTKSRPGQWRVSNSLEITLRDVNRASEVTELLSRSGATSVWGPNFYVNKDTVVEIDLLNKALENAKQKAGSIAESNGKKLGKIISITEGRQSVSPLRFAEGIGGGGIPVESGSSTIEK